MNRARLFQLQYRLAPYVFLLPFVVLFAVFICYPLGRSLVLSTYSTAGGPARERFVGLANYQFLFHDRLFWGAVANTAAFAVGMLLLQLPLSLGLALLVNSKRLVFRSAFRFAFFSTYLVGGVVGGVLFAMLLNPHHGLLNTVLERIVRRPVEINWLGSPSLALVSVLIVALWLSVGFGMIYLLAGLQSIDTDLYEAAAIDGASRWGRFIHITLPGLRPMLRFLLLVGTINAFQLFELPDGLFRQSTGPGSRGITVVMYLFITGFQVGDLGYASAVGWGLVLIIGVFSALQLKSLRRFE
jgi:ABC-type sugar transport system permease subunit